MFGRSMYLSNYNNDFVVDENADIYFTSFHIAEEFNDEYSKCAKKLLKQLKDAHKKVIVDISPRGVEQLGYSSLSSFVQDQNIDIIRLDYGFSIDEMIEVGKYATVALNASTIDDDTIDSLSNHNISLMAIHNFYPRKETGLDREYFEKCNERLRRKGVLIGAFISGDENLRGPMYEGLPTLEDHRFAKPYIQYMEMANLYGVDIIMVGDYGISKEQEHLIRKSIDEHVITLPVCLDKEYAYLYNTPYTNRVDSPKGLVRIQESREYATKGKVITPKNTMERIKGSITIDNEKYLRYSGEIQIMKDDYPMDEKVNVIGHVDWDYLDLVDLIDRNSKILFVEK